MRVYLGGANRPRLKKARELAPSHVFGVTWTPSDQRLSQVPYFVDNGAYTGSFDPGEWVPLLDELDRYGYRPDFVVLPDVYNDAQATQELHEEWSSAVLGRGLTAASVAQPGLPVAEQVVFADDIGARVVFVGGDNNWKWAKMGTIVEEAHNRELLVHVGNPGGAGGLKRAYTSRVDSVDTSSICQNESWHWVEQLQEATEDYSRSNSQQNSTQQLELPGAVPEVDQ